MITIKMKMATGFVGAIHRTSFEVEEEFWDSMNEQEMEEYLTQAEQDFIYNNISIVSEVVRG